MEHKLAKLKASLISYVKDYKDPVLCWSGGKDSSLILQLIYQLGYRIPVLVFPHLWSEYQKTFIKEMIVDLKLTAFHYGPDKINFDPPFVVSFYRFQDKQIPIIQDHVDDPSRCGLDVGRRIKFNAPKPAYHWDNTILGSKSCDTHKLIDQLSFDDFSVELPLWNWSDEEVLNVTKLLGFKFDKKVYNDLDERADTGNFVACMECIGVNDVFCPKENKVIKGLYST